MRNRGILILISTLALTLAGSAIADIEIEFDRDLIKYDAGDFNIEYADLKSVTLNPNLTLPIKTIYFEILDQSWLNDIECEIQNEIMLGDLPLEVINIADNFTGFDKATASLLDDKLVAASTPLFNAQSFKRGGKSYASLAILPVTVDLSGRLRFNQKLKIILPTVSAIISKEELIEQLSFEDNYVTANKTTSNGALPLGVDYVIITVDSLADYFEPLVSYRTSTGYSVGVALVDSIVATYDGVDDPEKIRNYLIDFHRSGGEYALLGGDNINVPVRYVYYYNADAPPSNPYYLMPSDLYYSDLDGIWNLDGDEVWGEPTDDAPNIYPEIKLGRLPVLCGQSIANYINKLIAYETNPGDGDYDYLNRSLMFSSDEMRDYPEEGQHGAIASGLPSHIGVDTSRTIELPNGGDANPVNPLGEDGVQQISNGYGFVHIIAHGRIDGFVVRSANYGDWPASLIITEPQDGTNGCILDLEKNNKSSLYYSLSCNLGGFDLDSLGGAPTDWSLVERLISSDSSGAAAMVANSRWGWVYSSYHLQESFTERLYTTANGSPVTAMYESWIDNPYYRDLIYGQNYFGDPALNIFTDVPENIEVVFEKEDDYLLYAYSQNGPIAGAFVNLERDGESIISGFTNMNGEFEVTGEILPDRQYILTIVEQNHTVLHEIFIPSITLDAEDDDEYLLPAQFELRQNYPNPFNPTTTIGFSLPGKSDVSLTVFNIVGQTVRRIEEYELTAGYHEIRFEAYDDNGSQLPSGIYFYRLTTGEFTETKKMVMLK